MSTATYVTPERYAAISDLPICLPQTELRRGTTVQIASFRLGPGQRAIIRAMFMNIISVLTPGVSQDAVNSSFGWCYAGVFAGHMVSSPFIYVAASQVGVTGLTTTADKVIASPGLYTVMLVNNTGKTPDRAIDLAVCVTGVIKFYQ